jgi:hypothetical protein
MNMLLQNVLSSIKTKMEHVRSISRPTEVAAIHATVLSILIGAFSAYFIYVHGEIREKQQEAMNKAEQINKIQFVRSAYLPRGREIFMAEGSKDIEGVRKNLIELALLTSIQPGGTPIGDGHLKIPEDPAVRAERMLQIMNVVSHRYPFPKAVEGSSQFRPEPVQFTDILVLRQWINDLRDVLTVLKPVTHFLPLLYPGQVSPYLEALSVMEKENIEKSKTDPVYKIMGEVNPYIAFNNFINGMLQADEIYFSTLNALIRADNIQKNSISKPLFLVVLCGGLIVFIFGVILPLVSSRVNAFLYIYLPLTYYTFIYCAIIVKMMRL